MTDERESQIEQDILAFVNGQLDAERRFAVAEYLSTQPERAAEVMADLRLTEGLRLAVGAVDDPPSPQLRQAAERLGSGLQQRRTLMRWLPFASAAAMFAFGWTAQGMLNQPAADAHAGGVSQLLETAIDAQDAVALRLSLSTRSGPVLRDPQEISEKLGIELPSLPPGWKIRAAQVVATPERPGVALMISTPDLGDILLFSVLRSVDGPDAPAYATTRDGRALAFFERDRTAYVLVDAKGPPGALRQGAETLRHRFN